MKKLYKQWKYARLRTWLIVFFLMFSIIPLGVLGIIVFQLSKAELTKQAQEHFWQNAKNTSALLDNELDYIEEFSLKMNADSRLYDIFRELDTENGLQLEEASKQITRILLNYLPWNNSVYSTHLVTSYYRFGEEEKNFYPKNSFVESGMLRQAREADGKLVWIPTYNYVEMFQINGINQNNLEYKRLFSAVRRLNPSNISSGRILHLDSDVERPYLVVNFTEENLRSMLREYVRKESEAQYFVVTEQGEVVCSSYGDGDGEFADITVEDIGISAESDCVRRKINGEDYIIAYAESEVTGWYVVAALPVKILTEKIADNLMRVILALILLMTVLSFGISFI
ncbi:MAG: cache domain-containing protein, partial [Lachnospiraceae bacterium]|nr:cache domain-containing protein [Lachnospiraceae bacterium]